MRYNVFVKLGLKTYNILDIDENELKKIAESYNCGVDFFFIKGKKYWIKKLNEIQVFTFENDNISTEQQLLDFCRSNNLTNYGYGSNEYIPISVLEKLGKRVTDGFITGDYGYVKNNVVNSKSDKLFVDLNRIDKLSKINNPQFDYSKLIRMLEELNITFANSCFMSVSFLIRAIIDHVPPIFNKQNFGSVCGGHGSKSFQDCMKHLDNSSRKIANSYLHIQIRNKEVLPTELQVNFCQDLDVLLQEIIRVS